VSLSKDVISALNYVRLFAGTQIIVKLGGSVLQDDILLHSICEDLTAIRKVGVSIILVHGGGPAINEELKRRGIEWNFIDGLRVTTPEMMSVIEMVLCGNVNRRIVRALGAAGLKAVGFSGADASTLICRKTDERLGQVGTIERVNAQLIDHVLGMKDELGERGIPVIAPVGVGRDGSAFNINADWVASRVASHCSVTKMVFLTDQDGILDSSGRLIPELDAGELEQLIEDGTVKGGMLAKARTILHALQNKVTDVHILNAKAPNALIAELFTDQGSGTVCRLRSRAGAVSPSVVSGSAREL
jgi:acetylglutamate kinase